MPYNMVKSSVLWRQKTNYRQRATWWVALGLIFRYKSTHGTHEKNVRTCVSFFFSLVWMKMKG